MRKFDLTIKKSVMVVLGFVLLCGQSYGTKIKKHRDKIRLGGYAKVTQEKVIDVGAGGEDDILVKTQKPGDAAADMSSRIMSDDGRQLGAEGNVEAGQKAEDDGVGDRLGQNPFAVAGNCFGRLDRCHELFVHYTRPYSRASFCQAGRLRSITSSSIQ